MRPFLLRRSDVDLTPDMVQWLVGQVIVAAAIWGGLRADIRHMHGRLDHLERATNDAHSRLDNHLEGCRRQHERL